MPSFFRICLAMLLLAQTVHSQTGSIDLKWGEEYEIQKKYEDLGFIGDAGIGYTQVSHREGSGLVMQKFGADLKIANEKALKPESLPRNYQSEFMVRAGSRYYWFFSSGGRSGNSVLFAQEINPATTELSGAPKELLSVEDIGDNLTLDAYAVRKANRFTCYQSADSSKILIQYRKQPEHRNDSRSNDVIGLFVFDAQLNKVAGAEVTMPYTEKLQDNIDYSVDSKGNMYLLAKVYSAPPTPAEKHPMYRYELLKWPADGGKQSKIPFRVPGKFISSARIGETPAGDIAVAGFYASRKEGTATGVFVVKIAEGATVVDGTTAGFSELPKALLDGYQERRKRKGFLISKGLLEDNVLLRKLVFNNDGSVEVYGEEQHIEADWQKLGDVRQLVYYYQYNDIWVAKMDAQRALSWAVSVPKDQEGGEYLGCMSFKHHCYAGKNYLLFLQGPKNAMFRDEKPGILVAAVVGADGSVSQSNVSELTDDRIKLTVSDLTSVGPDRLMTRGRAKNHVSKASLITFQ